MGINEQWETLDDLKAAGASYDQVRNWRGRMLIPRPQKPGRGRGKGSVALYPIGTIRRVTRIQELLEERRSLDYVGWSLWLEGYPVASFVHEALVSWASLVEDQIAGLATRLEQAIDDVDLARELKTLPGMGWVRRFIKPENYPMLLDLVVKAFKGSVGYSVNDPEDVKHLRRLIDRGGKFLGIEEHFIAELKKDPRGFTETAATYFRQLLHFGAGLTERELLAIRAEAAEIQKLWKGIDNSSDIPTPIPFGLFYMTLGVRMGSETLLSVVQGGKSNGLVDFLLNPLMKQRILSGDWSPIRPLSPALSDGAPESIIYYIK